VATGTKRRRPNNKPSQIQPIAADSKINLMLYAHPGIGKTTMIGSGPDKSLVIRPPTDSADPIKRQNPRMEQWEVTGWQDMDEALEWLRDERGGGYEWVWLDSISLMQDTGLDDIWEDVIAKKPARKEYGLDKGEYGVNMFRLSQWVRHMVGAKAFNLGITAHPAILPNPDKDDEEDESQPDDILMPWIQGKQMATKICGYMNCVAYLRVQKVKSKGEVVRRRVLYTDANGIYYAKNSLGQIPNGRLINPTLPKLTKYLLGNGATAEE
jgi:hypothetical protein